VIKQTVRGGETDGSGLPGVSAEVTIKLKHGLRLTASGGWGARGRRGGGHHL
jgi:hypothetical protein